MSVGTLLEVEIAAHGPASAAWLRPFGGLNLLGLFLPRLPADKVGALGLVNGSDSGRAECSSRTVLVFVLARSLWSPTLQPLGGYG